MYSILFHTITQAIMLKNKKSRAPVMYSVNDTCVSLGIWEVNLKSNDKKSLRDFLSEASTSVNAQVLSPCGNQSCVCRLLMSYLASIYLWCLLCCLLDKCATLYVHDISAA